jgi:hypothetical protein
MAVQRLPKIRPGDEGTGQRNSFLRNSKALSGHPTAEGIKAKCPARP